LVVELAGDDGERRERVVCQPQPRDLPTPHFLERAKSGFIFSTDDTE
jgi:hypothetical protein